MNFPMKKDPYGVWEVTVPPKEPGVCAIPHDSKVKVGSVSSFLFNVYFTRIFLDFYDYTLWRAY